MQFEVHENPFCSREGIRSRNARGECDGSGLYSPEIVDYINRPRVITTIFIHNISSSLRSMKSLNLHEIGSRSQNASCGVCSS